MESGYTAPPSFKPDKALMKAYADEVCRGIGSRGQDDLLDPGASRGHQEAQRAHPMSWVVTGGKS